MSHDEQLPITLWQFLKKYNCIIPLIQRDYAQGRKGKEHLRQKFFGQLIEALKENTPLRLDFVYGYPKESDSCTIYPLDGQQRLTSLWLLHWYLAYKTNSLTDPDFCDTMKKFSYQTRISSRDFCLQLFQSLLPSDNPDVKARITAQPWFSRRFKKDPTVQAMLRALSDTETGTGFEQLLANYEVEDMKKMLEALISDRCPIKFYFRSTEKGEIANPDDLYVKMNARGKKLTQFENFKAELFSYKDENGLEVFRRDDGQDLDFIKKFENQWTNIFWPLRHNTQNIIDHIQHEFFNRMALTYIIAKDKIEEDAGNNLYDHIRNHKEFTSIKVYKPVLNTEFKTLFANVLDGIRATGLQDKELLGLPYFPIYRYNDENKEKNNFEIKEKENSYWISGITVPLLAQFYAASRFFTAYNQKAKEKPFNRNAFEDWMRICNNIINNSDIDRYEGLSTLFKLFDNIGDGCLCIINYLSTLNANDHPKSNIDTQFEEEREKAVKIAAFRNHTAEINYEELIIDAEKRFRTKGAIRYLFTNDNGVYDWNDFKIKKNNFDSIIENSSENKITTLVLRSFISLIDDWHTLGKFRYDSANDAWYDILLRRPELRRYVHTLLLSYPIDENALENFDSPFSDPRKKATHQELVRTKILEETTWNKFWFYPDAHTLRIPYTSVERKRYRLGSPRNELIKEGLKKGDLIEIIFDSSRIVEGQYIRGDQFYFKHKDNDSLIFWWNKTADEDRIYLCHNKDNYDYVDKESPKDYSIDVSKVYDIPPIDWTYDAFENELKDLLARFSSSKVQG